jgi:hypothetical protein
MSRTVQARTEYPFFNLLAEKKIKEFFMDAILSSEVFTQEFWKGCLELVKTELSKPEFRACIEQYFLDPCLEYFYHRFRFFILSSVALAATFGLLLLAVFGTVVWLGAKIYTLSL